MLLEGLDGQLVRAGGHPAALCVPASHSTLARSMTLSAGRHRGEREAVGEGGGDRERQKLRD